MTPKAFGVDSSVLLDALTNSAAHADSSEQALRKAAGESRLIICECVLAEIRPTFASAGQLDEFVADWELRFVPSSRESALLAEEIFAAYVQRTRRKGGIIADFLIAAHAKVHADRLLARDRLSARLFFFPETPHSQMTNRRFVATEHLREASTGYVEMMQTLAAVCITWGFFHASLHPHQVVAAITTLWASRSSVDRASYSNLANQALVCE